MAARSIAGALLLTLAGCTVPCKAGETRPECAADAGGDAGNGNSPEVQFCLDKLNAGTDLLIRCNALHPGAVADRRAQNETFCRAHSWSHEVRDGRATLDPAAVARCLASLSAITCTDTGDMVQYSYRDCWAAAVGLSAENGACFAHEDCGEGLECDTTDTCPGRCIPRRALGQPATDQALCVEGAEPYNGVCSGLIVEGQSCAPDGGSSRHHGCVAPARCLYSTRVCTVLPPNQAPGQSCSSTLGPDCGTGTQCVSGTCQSMVVEGGSCDDERRCQFGLLCGTGGTCVPLRDAGEPCTLNALTEQCREGYCVRDPISSAGTCQPFGRLGDNCDGVACGYGLFCDVRTSRPPICKILGTEGSPCVEWVQCHRDLYWCDTDGGVFGVCTKRKANGESCGTGSTFLATEECLGVECSLGICTGEIWCSGPF